MSHSPDYTPTERWAIVIMGAAVLLAYALITLATESASRHAAKNWPPPVSQERTSK